MLHVLKLRYKYWLRFDERTLTFAITTLLFVGLYFLLNQWALPDTRLQTEDFETIEFEKFIPPPPKPPEVQKPKEETPTKLDPAAQAPQQPALFDFKLFEQLDELVAPPQKELVEITQTKVDLTSFQIPKIDLQNQQFVEHAPQVRNDFGDIPIEASKPDAMPQANIDVKNAKTSFWPLGGEGKKVGTVNVAGKQQVEEKVTKIEPKQMSQAEIDKRLNELFMKLLQWLKANHVELSPTMQKYLNYKAGDLTSRVQVQVQGELFQLILICNEISQDIGILLVRESDNEVIYLRDSGFRRESHYLSKGVALRDAHKQVLSVSTSEEAPTREETGKFYGIFLSWWESRN